MRLNRVMLRLVFCAIPVLWAVAPVRADFIGEGWIASQSVVDDATPANVPVTAPDFTFTASAIDFSSFGNLANTGNGSADYTVNTYLNSLGSATSITDITAGIGTMSLSIGTGGILLDITGMASVTNGESFTVAHDDGLTITIGGVVAVSDPGPTSPTITGGTYTGPTGNEPFQIVYGECCGAPAVLETTLTGAPPAVPEPASIALFGTALLGLGLLRRKSRKA